MAAEAGTEAVGIMAVTEAMVTGPDTTTEDVETTGVDAATDAITITTDATTGIELFEVLANL
jgi:hypothetical protein